MSLPTSKIICCKAVKPRHGYGFEISVLNKNFSDVKNIIPSVILANIYSIFEVMTEGISSVYN